MPPKGAHPAPRKVSKVRSEIDVPVRSGSKRKSLVKRPSERRISRAQSVKDLKKNKRKASNGRVTEKRRSTLKQKSNRKLIKQPSLLRQLSSFADNGMFHLNAKAEAVAENLQLTEAELRRLKRQFNLYNVEKSGHITYEEFFNMIGDKRSPYTDALFAMIDENRDGTIDFNEFVQVLGTYCSFSRNDIYRFIFDVFDKDGSGTIDEQEFIDMCTKLNASTPIFPGSFKKVMQTFDTNGDGLIDFREFCQLNKRYPLINAPALLLQDRMQKATLGETKWTSILKNRARQRYIEEYQARHDGLLPPEDFATRMYYCCFPRRSASHYGVKRTSLPPQPQVQT